jgi:hypothetical protein
MAGAYYWRADISFDRVTKHQLRGAHHHNRRFAMAEHTRNLRLFRIVAGGILASALAAGQSTGAATMAGAVTDSTGAVVPGARITITSTEAGFVFNSITNNEATW